MKSAKDIAVLALPLSLFAILLIPYSWIQQHFIVDWLGCGCPQTDASGNVVLTFNTNHFTGLFWLLIVLCATVTSGFLSRRIPKEKMWLRILYIVGILAVSLWIAYHFYIMMMVK